MNKEQLVSMTKELDALLPMPTHPDDENAPVMFGVGGIVVMTDNGSPLLLGCYDDPSDLFADTSIAPFGNGFGHLLFVHYGVLTELENEETPMRPMRVIVGITPDGLTTSLFRDVSENEIVFVDENCEQTPNDPFLELFG
jgi:hypothetical protein